jgi:hypothetical protein
MAAEAEIAPGKKIFLLYFVTIIITENHVQVHHNKIFHKRRIIFYHLNKGMPHRRHYRFKTVFRILPVHGILREPR